MQNIYRSAAQVTAFSTAEKALSFFYRIALSRIIGAEGLGIYQICLTLFAVFLTASSSGVPITVSRLMAKSDAKGDLSGKHAAVSAGVISTLFITVPVVLIMFLGRGFFGFLLPSDGAMRIFLILLPSLILTSVYAVIRGAFWGNKQFLPYSVIELLEDAVMVVCGIALVSGITEPLKGAERAAWAVVISYVFSFTVSVFWYLKKGGKFVNPKRQLKPLLSASAPITAMRTATSLLNSAVAVLLPALLVRTAGLTNSEAVALYGSAIGMAVPILFIPSALIGSIAVVVAPELSGNFYKNKSEAVRKDVEKSIKAAIFIATAIIPVLFVVGDEIGDFLYSDGMSGAIVQRCCIILFPMCIGMITTTILNSMNCEKRTLAYFGAGAAGMLICIVALTKFIGIYSYMVGLAVNFTLTCALNLAYLNKKCDGLKYGRYFLKCFAAAAAACAFGTLLDGLISPLVGSVWQLIICGACTFLFTAAALYLLKAFTFSPVKKLLKRR